jgi:SNF family Na+-dependent transporter
MVFSAMPAGGFFGCAFFFLLFLAAITSSLSMLQPGIALLEEALDTGRKTSVALLAFFTTVGTGMVAYFTGDGMKALDTLDFWVGTFLLFVMATAQIIVFGWVVGVERGLGWTNEGGSLQVPRLFAFVIKWLCPGFLLAVFGMWLLKNVFGVSLEGGDARPSQYVRDLFVEPNAVAWMCVALIGLLFVTLCLLAARSKTYRKPVTWEPGEF